MDHNAGRPVFGQRPFDESVLPLPLRLRFHLQSQVRIQRVSARSQLMKSEVAFMQSENHEEQREATLEASSVTRRFGLVTAVDNLNLAVGPGELFCLLGALFPASRAASLEPAEALATR